MSTAIRRLDEILRRVDLSGLADVSFSGQIVENVWHASDCSIVGSHNSPISPFPWAYLDDKMTATCCALDLEKLTDELSPPALSSIVRALDVVDEALATLQGMQDDVSITSFADLGPLDAAIDFQSNLDEIVTGVASRALGLHGRYLGYYDAELKDLHRKLGEVRAVRYGDTDYLDDLYHVVRDVLGIERDENLVLTSFSANSRVEPEHMLESYLLQALTTTFALDALIDFDTAILPMWAYNAMQRLGGQVWMSQPHVGLEEMVVETARVLWDRNPDSPMHDFDACVAAASAL